MSAQKNMLPKADTNPKPADRTTACGRLKPLVGRPNAGEIAAALQVLAAVRTDEIDQISGLLRSHIALLGMAAELLPLEDLRALTAHKADIVLCIDGSFARRINACSRHWSAQRLN